jgi:hypothetical protein
MRAHISTAFLHHDGIDSKDRHAEPLRSLSNEFGEGICSGFALRLLGHERFGSGGLSKGSQHPVWPTNASPGLSREGKAVAMLVKQALDGLSTDAVHGHSFQSKTGCACAMTADDGIDPTTVQRIG